MKRRSVFSILSAFALVRLSGLSARAQSSYTFTTLGTPGGSSRLRSDESARLRL